MKYADIDKVNSEIKMLDLKGKNYAMVPERVTAFRKLYPDGFITTDIVHLSEDGTVVMMKATAGYYKEDGTAVVLGSGMAKEVQGKGMVNGTSHIENCETSAVGRALGMIGLGLNGGGICSAEELVNAITAQNQMKADQKVELQQVNSDFVAPKTKASAKVETGSKVPSLSPEMQYLNDELNKYSKETKQTFDEAKAAFRAVQIKSVKDGISPNKSLSEYTIDELSLIIDIMKAGHKAA